MNEKSKYYKGVSAYYDGNARQIEINYLTNKALRLIRSSFRKETSRFQLQQTLEIGFGHGKDLVYFAQKFHDKKFYGIDISLEMVKQTQKEIDAFKLDNVSIVNGSVEDIETSFPGVKFDLIYIYFGALSTFEDLSLAAACLKKCLAPRGKIILTVINKWYFAGLLSSIIKLKFGSAFRRLGGKAPILKLDSKCYSPSEIKKAFKGFNVIKKRGYSICFPAWYQQGFNKLGLISNFLWRVDKKLNKTPLWSKGEHTLFVLELS